LILFVGLALVNYFVLGDHVLWLIRRQGLALSSYFRGGSEREDVLLEVALLDELFEVLARYRHWAIRCPEQSWKEQ